MRKFGLIPSHYWIWAKKNKVKEKAVLIGAFLMSCDHSNSLGCFKCPPEYASADLWYSIDDTKHAYFELIEKKLFKYCQNSKYIFFPDYLDWFKIQNSKHGKGTIKLALELPLDFSYYQDLINSLKKYSNKYLPLEKLIKDLSKRENTGMDTGIDTGMDTGIDSLSINRNRKRNRNKQSSPEGLPEIKNIAKELYESNMFKEVYAFINKCRKEKIHEKAILRALTQYKTHGSLKNLPPKGVWAYCQHIVSVESGNFYEAETVEKHEAIKKISDFLNNFGEIT